MINHTTLTRCGLSLGAGFGILMRLIATHLQYQRAFFFDSGELFAYIEVVGLVFVLLCFAINTTFRCPLSHALIFLELARVAPANMLSTTQKANMFLPSRIAEAS